MINEVLIGGAIFTSAYSLYRYQVDSIEKNEYIIENSKIPKEFDNFNIVQISDLHNKSFGKDNKKLLNAIDKLSPDIVVITGNLVDGENKKFNIALNLIDDLTKKYKVYHIIGNHEQKSLIKRYKDLYNNYFKELYSRNIINLENEVVKIEKNNSHINIYGLIIPLDYYKYFFSNSKNKNSNLDKKFIENTLGKINKNEYNILLSHTPFFFEEYASWGADLVLAGHVHGGIIRIPYMGGLLSPNREFFPKYDFGTYNKEESTMLLSKGLGGSRILMRINCRPEIVKITLKHK
ncbi:metallophosphoesterase [[Clostridium] dakarense]|uniref:metallophosphoesterase n=1 Tax=Faecalimicrobium dakarense TaxID=1301100 RepID=UPI0004B504C2|nr:metallophosphoesterase [[Clostridium] dakarense]